MSDLRLAAEVSADFPRTILVHPGTTEAGESFFGSRHPEAIAIADPELRLYGAFGVSRGRLGQLLGPRTLARSVGAMLRGHGVGKPAGDVKVMPGLFLVHQGEIVWRHDYRHAGERPDLEAVLRRSRSLTAGGPDMEAA